MNSRYSQLAIKSTAFKSIGVYTFSNFLTKAVSFASLPLFTYILSKNDFGIISIFSSSINFLTPFIALGVLYSTSTDFFKLEKREFSSFVKTTSAIPVVMTSIGMVAFLIFFPFFRSIGFHYSFVFLVPLIAYLNFLFEQNITLLRNNNQTRQYLILTICKVVIELSFAFTLIAVFRMDWHGRVYGIIAAFLFCGIAAWWYLIKNGLLAGSFQWKIIRQELIFGLPALVTQFSIIFLNSSDRYFINHYLGSDRTGVYSLAATFASIIFIFNSALLQYIFPRLYASFAKNEYGAVVRKIFVKYILIILGCSILLLGFTWICYNFILNPVFISGLKYFYLLLFGYLIWAITYFFYSILLYFKQKVKMIILAVLSVTFCSILMNILVSRYQEAGATWAVGGAYGFILILMVIINYRQIRQIMVG
ncbi:MAG: oligosaccharide flippase family protein [Chitinophagaceae bacterium]